MQSPVAGGRGGKGAAGGLQRGAWRGGGGRRREGCRGKKTQQANSPRHHGAGPRGRKEDDRGGGGAFPPFARTRPGAGNPLPLLFPRTFTPLTPPPPPARLCVKPRYILWTLFDLTCLKSKPWQSPSRAELAGGRGGHEVEISFHTTVVSLQSNPLPEQTL